MGTACRRVLNDCEILMCGLALLVRKSENGLLRLGSATPTRRVIPGTNSRLPTPDGCGCSRLASPLIRDDADRCPTQSSQE